jgi:PAS domain S-box-containing protein
MRTKKVTEHTKRKDSKKSSDLRKRPEKKSAKIGGKELNRWPKRAQKRNVHPKQKAGERTTELRALNRELSFKAAKLEQRLSESRQTQKKLNHLASFPEMNPNPAVEVDFDGSIQYLNPAAKKLFPDLQETGHQHEWLVDLKTIGTFLKDPKKASYVREIQIGSSWFEQFFSRTPEQDRIRIYAHDITERKHVEQERERLRAEAENERRRLEAVMDALPVGIAITDAKGGTIRFNQVFDAIWGKPRPTALSVSDYAVYEAWWPETGEPVAPEEWASAQAVRKGQSVVGQLLEIQRFDGSRASVINSGAPIFDLEGKIAGCAVAIQDITDLRKAEQAVRESESKYRSLFDNMSDGFAYHKILLNDRGTAIDYVFLEVNDAFEKLTGLKKENVIGRKVTEVLPGIEKDSADWIGTYGRVALTGKSIRFENYSEALRKWYSVSAYSPGEGYFAALIEDVTERKCAEDALRTSLERYRSYIEVTGELGWTTNADGEVMEDLPSFRKFTGQTDEEIKGWGWSKALHPDDLEYTTQIWREAVRSKNNYEVEYRLRRHDGIYRYFLARGTPVFEENGSIREWVGTCIDITDRKRMEEELRKSRHELEMRVQLRTAELVKANELLEGMFSSINTMIAYMDKDFNFIRVNRAYAEADERNPEFYIGKNHFVLFPNEENEQTFRKVVETGEPNSVYAKPFEYAEHPERGVTYWDWSLQPVKEPDGSVGGVVLSLVNVTERIRAEESVRRNEVLLRTVFETLPVGVWLADKEGHIVHGNPAGQEIWAGARYVGIDQFGEYKGWWVETGKQIEPEEWAVARAVRRGETSINEEIEIECFDGSHKIILNSAVPIRDEKEEIIGAFIVNQDITERKRTEERLREQAALLELAHDAIIVRDMENRILFWNRGAEEIYGWKKSEALEKATGDLLQTEFPILLDEIKIDLIRKGHWEGELVHTRRDGKKIIVESRWAIQLGKEGRPTVILQINRDVTDRKQAQEAVEAERQRFNDVLEILPAYLVLLSKDYHVPFANRFFRERFGESHGQRCFEYLFGRSEPCETCESFTALKTMAPHGWEWTGPDGRNYNVFDFPFTDTDGSVLILEMGIDITEGKRAEEALKAASLYTRSLIEASLDPLVTISADGKIMDVNKAMELVTGVSRESLVGTDSSNYFTDPEKARERYEEVFSKGFVRDYPLAIRHTSGKVRDVLYNATVYRNEAGEIQGVFAAARDITERKRMEEELRKSENRLRLLSSQLINVQEAERKRIAREIHDSIGQTLAAIKFALESKLSQMGGGVAPPGVSIENIISLTQGGIEESRRIQMDLRPSVLDDLGFLATIGWFTREFQKVYLHISVEKHISVEENEIPDSLRTVLFRVMQEAMNNVAKHSNANLVRLILKKMDGRIVLTIEDNGAGFEPESTKQGLGLTSMRERAELSGGTFEVDSILGKGTMIRASWPL